MGNSSSRSRTRPPLLCVAIVSTLSALTSLAGCGGAGGGSVAAATTQLAFSVKWEQRLAEGGTALATSTAPDGAALGFDTPIPPSVNAVRFLYHPASPGTACCISVVRGSQAFLDRHIVLANITAGLGMLEVNGFPSEQVPDGGIPATCATKSADQGSACSGAANLLPSFASDAIEVDVIPNRTNVVDVDVHSLPFVLNLAPQDGATVHTTTPDLDFTVVDANHAVSSGVAIRVRNLPATENPAVLTAVECMDGDEELPDCSVDGELEVQGRIIHSHVNTPLPAGQAQLRIRASNAAEAAHDMESNTVFNVIPPDTTTTSTSTTEVPTTSTSTTEVPPQTFCLNFSVPGRIDLIGLSYDVDYSAAGGGFDGSTDAVSCRSLLTTNPNSTLTTFNDNEATSMLRTAVISVDTFTGPVGIATCSYTQVPPLDLGNFIVTVTEATAPDLSPTSATVIVEETTCP